MMNRYCIIYRYETRFFNKKNVKENYIIITAKDRDDAIQKAKKRLGTYYQMSIFVEVDNKT